MSGLEVACIAIGAAVVGACLGALWQVQWWQREMDDLFDAFDAYTASVDEWTQAAASEREAADNLIASLRILADLKAEADA